MRICCSRISELLKPAGFVIRHPSGLANTCAFVREDRTRSLFQQIDVSFAGRHKEAAVAHVTVSVTRWLRVKGLSVSRLLDEIATDQDRGWSVIATEGEAQSWEKSLAQLGPLKAREIAVEAGGALLERTCDARNVAQTLLARFDRGRDVRDCLEEFARAMPSERIAEAKRLAVSPGVLQVTGSEHIYLLACLAVLNGDHGSSLLGQDPLTSQMLMWEIQLVADGIMPRYISRV